MRSLLKAEKALFDTLCADYKDLCLVSTKLRGIETATIAHVAVGDAGVHLTPLVVLVNAEIFKLLKDPAAD